MSAKAPLDPVALANAKARGKRPYFFRDPDVERVLSIAMPTWPITPGASDVAMKIRSPARMSWVNQSTATPRFACSTLECGRLIPICR